MRFQGQAKLGFFPLPPSEAARVRKWLSFPAQFSALDPCVGDRAAFATLLESSNGLRYGIAIDAHRSAQARTRGFEVLHANTLDVRCGADSVSLLYLNPPYDWEFRMAASCRRRFRLNPMLKQRSLISQVRTPTVRTDGCAPLYGSFDLWATWTAESELPSRRTGSLHRALRRGRCPLRAHRSHA